MDSASYISVYYTNASGTVVLLPASQYTLFLNPASPGQLWGIGGTVTYPIAGSPIPNGTSLTILRTLPFQQLISISNQGDFAPEVIEEMGDALEMQIQQVGALQGRAISIPAADPSGINTTLPGASARANKYVTFDASGNVIVGGNPSNTPTDLTNYFVTATGANTSRILGAYFADAFNVNNFGAKPDNATSNTTSIQAALNAMTSGGVLNFPGPGTYLSGALTIPYANITINIPQGTTLKFPTLGASTYGFTVSANNFEIRGGGIIQGPAAGAYVSEERGISMLGSSTSSRKSGLKIIGMEIKNFGSEGIYTQFVDDIYVEDNRIHDCGYAGMMYLSSNYGRAANNIVHDITPGTASNMYGISLTHITVGYNVDPNAGTKQATNPFCWGWEIDNNIVYNNAWTGIDSHGGYEVNIHDNIIYSCALGILLAKSSGDAVAYAGYSNKLINNTIDASNPNGTASGYENGSLSGLYVSGGSTLSHYRVIVSGNILRGYGQTDSAGAAALSATNCTDLTIANNEIINWNGIAIDITSSADAAVNNNLIGGVTNAGTTNKICIQNAAGTSLNLHLNGNTHLSSDTGHAARIGLNLSGSTTPIVFYGLNNFSQCTVNQINALNSIKLLGGGVANTIVATDADGSPSVLVLQGGGPGTLQLNTVASPYNITTLDDGIEGQTVTIQNMVATAVTLKQGTTMKLLGGADVVLNIYDNATLKLFGSTWVQQGATGNNA